MTTYYIQKDLDIVLADTDRQRLENTLLFKPDLVGLPIFETEGVVYEGKVITQEEYQAILDQKEAERIAMLKLTRGDVFRGLLMAKQVTRAMIRQQLEAMPETTPEEILTKEMALIDFDEALDFYRGNALIDTVGLALGITKEQLDEFFEDGNYEHLLPLEVENDI